MDKLYTIDEVKKFINSNKKMVISGDEALLNMLPEGNWVGGTIPYFMGTNGGTIDRERLFVNFLPSEVSNISIKSYSKESINQVYSDAYNKGFSLIIIPATSSVHLDFALKASSYKDFLKVPLIGWISGVHLNDLGKESPKVVFGPNKQIYTDKAVAVHCKLKENKHADINIINIFKPDSQSPSISFQEDGFSVGKCLIDGEEKLFADYLTENNIDTKNPLIADYNGVMVNTSFQNIDTKNGKVDFYAPIFEGITYNFSSSKGDYIQEFNNQLEAIEQEEKVVLSFNCILNFLYCELEGKKIGNVTGPITFGEIAYQLLNQTLVYLTIS